MCTCEGEVDHFDLGWLGTMGTAIIGYLTGTDYRMKAKIETTPDYQMDALVHSLRVHNLQLNKKTGIVTFYGDRVDLNEISDEWKSDIKKAYNEYIRHPRAYDCTSTGRCMVTPANHFSDKTWKALDGMSEKKFFHHVSNHFLKYLPEELKKAKTSIEKINAWHTYYSDAKHPRSHLVSNIEAYVDSFAAEHGDYSIFFREVVKKQINYDRVADLIQFNFIKGPEFNKIKQEIDELLSDDQTDETRLVSMTQAYKSAQEYVEYGDLSKKVKTLGDAIQKLKGSIEKSKLADFERAAEEAVAEAAAKDPSVPQYSLEDGMRTTFAHRKAYSDVRNALKKQLGVSVPVDGYASNVLQAVKNLKLEDLRSIRDYIIEAEWNRKKIDAMTDVAKRKYEVALESLGWHYDEETSQILDQDYVLHASVHVQESDKKIMKKAVNKFRRTLGEDPDDEGAEPWYSGMGLDYYWRDLKPIIYRDQTALERFFSLLSETTLKTIHIFDNVARDDAHYFADQVFMWGGVAIVVGFLIRKSTQQGNETQLPPSPSPSRPLRSRPMGPPESAPSSPSSTSPRETLEDYLRSLDDRLPPSPSSPPSPPSRGSPPSPPPRVPIVPRYAPLPLVPFDDITSIQIGEVVITPVVVARPA